MIKKKMAKENHFNVVNVMFLVIALIGLIFLAGLKIDAGSFYLLLTSVGFIFLMIAVFAKFVAKIDFWFEIPIYSSNSRGISMLFLGIFLLLCLVITSSMLSLNFYNPYYFAPLSSFGNSLSIADSSFAALQTITSSFGTFFIIVIVASVIEELVLGFGFVMIGSLIGYGFRTLLKLDFTNKGKYYWDLIIANIFALFLFALLHTFNNTYLNSDGSMNMSLFFIAGLFRLVMNLLIYNFGNFGLLFSTGFHATNNAIYLTTLSTFGWLGMKEALTSKLGLLFCLFLLILFVYFITNIQDVIKQGKLIYKDLWTFD